MCKNQLGRRNLTPEQKTYLTGKQYEAERKTSGGQLENRNAQKRVDQSGQLVSGGTTRQRMTQGGLKNKNREEDTGRFTTNDQIGHLWQDTTRKKIAEQFGVGEGTVQRSEYYLQGLDQAERGCGRKTSATSTRKNNAEKGNLPF